ncbi:hypothetical protein FQR65_LT00013 [Abscondita terminalis]|nr:hypothetical protein FQR65_LT00013 [Abscondita terminalis]
MRPEDGKHKLERDNKDNSVTKIREQNDEESSAAETPDRKHNKRKCAEPSPQAYKEVEPKVVGNIKGDSSQPSPREFSNAFERLHQYGIGNHHTGGVNLRHDGARKEEVIDAVLDEPEKYCTIISVSTIYNQEMKYKDSSFVLWSDEVTFTRNCINNQYRF